jgi:hypothetical protein
MCFCDNVENDQFRMFPMSSTFLFHGPIVILPTNNSPLGKQEAESVAEGPVRAEGEWEGQLGAVL